MKAIVQDEYGPADVLKLEDVDMPAAGKGEVVVRVLAASVHIGDWHVMMGLPYLIRAVVPGMGFRAPKARVRGMDVAGRVETAGADVTQLRPGDEVFGIAKGSFAEFAPARADKIVAKPVNLTFDQAAACPISGLAALQGVRDKAKVQPGQKVLIIGAGGAVGTFAVQIAKAFGAHVTGVCSTSKVELVRSLGAAEVIDYTSEDFAENGTRYDAILDTAGARSVPSLRRSLTPKGTLVIVGSEGGGRWFGGFGRNLRAQMLSPFVSQKLGLFASKEKGEDLVVLKELIEAGKVKPVIDTEYPLNQVPDAFRRLEQGHARGKVVITV
jgi:2-desacetyl-2-hydroxyethyl bacteriochlorophyllide A dehydrogenase